MDLPSLRVLAFLAALPSVLGCAGTIDEITQRSTRSSVQVGVDELTDRATQEKIARNLHEEPLEELSRRLAAGVVDGAVTALEDPERRARIGRAFEGAAMPTGIDRIDDREVAQAVETALATTLSRVDRDAARGLAHDLVDEAVRTAVRAARDEMRDVDPQAEVAGVAREIGKQAAFGFQDAVDETARREGEGLIAEGEDAVLLAAGQAAERYNTWVIASMIGVGVVALALLGLVVSQHRRWKMHRAELEQRDDAILLLNEAVQETDGRPWSPALRDALAAAMRDKQRRDEARRLLREHHDSRNPPPPDLATGPQPISGRGAPRSGGGPSGVEPISRRAAEEARRRTGEGSPPSLRS